MTALARLSLLAAATFLMGSTCGPVPSKHPLSSRTRSVADPRLLGLWVATEDQCEDVVLHVLPGEGARIELVYIGQGDGSAGVVHSVVHLEAFPTRLAGRTYLSVRPAPGPLLDLRQPGVRDYLILRYELGRGGTLSLDYLGGNAIADAIRTGALAGTYRMGKGEIKLDDARVTAETPALAAFVAAADPAEAFEHYCTFRKVALTRRALPGG